MAKKVEIDRTPPPLKFEVIESYKYGDQKYELRQFSSGRVIYNYSNKFKNWVPYAKADIDRHWSSIKREY